MSKVAGLAISHKVGIGEDMDATDVSGSHSYEGKKPMHPVAHIHGAFVNAKDAIQPTRHEGADGK